jgi:hypothetical protein
MEIHDWHKTPPGQCSTLSMDVLSVSVRFIIFFFLQLASGISQAQDIEPRAYSNAPVGMNFLVAAYGYSEGGVSFDPSVRRTDDA